MTHVLLTEEFKHYVHLFLGLAVRADDGTVFTDDTAVVTC